ncbi:MAG: DUF4399 domain-containing protein, partial [Gammaproteobacteria bacterium]|nr:DUF4399 domain-containing protein [Gammaproteobacteria bacterium]
MPRTWILLGALLLTTTLNAQAGPDSAELYFITPADGATLSSPVTVTFGLRNMGVAPAGTDKAGTGHHHLIVDAPLPPLDHAIVNDEHHR